MCEDREEVCEDREGEGEEREAPGGHNTGTGCVRGQVMEIRRARVKLATWKR